MQALRVLSMNIHKGFSHFNTANMLPRLREQIRSVSADIVFLQEVLGERDDQDGPQYEFLADQVWKEFAYGRNAIYEGGHHGNAILSRFPIISWDNHNLSTNRLEQRGLLHCRVQLPYEHMELDLMCTHLNLLSGGRRLQYERIRQLWSEKGWGQRPLIFAGDFNDWTLEAQRELAEPLGLSEAFLSTRYSHARSFPALFPLLCLDRIYVHGMTVLESEVYTGPRWRVLSDHAAIGARLEVAYAHSRR